LFAILKYFKRLCAIKIGEILRRCLEISVARPTKTRKTEKICYNNVDPLIERSSAGADRVKKKAPGEEGVPPRSQVRKSPGRWTIGGDQTERHANDDED
jgi:hypothetical protein